MSVDLRWVPGAKNPEVHALEIVDAECNGIKRKVIQYKQSPELNKPMQEQQTKANLGVHSCNFEHFQQLQPDSVLVTARNPHPEAKDYAYYNMNSDINLIEIRGHWNSAFKLERVETSLIKPEDRFVWQFHRAEADLKSRLEDTKGWISSQNLFLYEGEINEAIKIAQKKQIQIQHVPYLKTKQSSVKAFAVRVHSIFYVKNNNKEKAKSILSGKPNGEAYEKAKKYLLQEGFKMVCEKEKKAPYKKSEIVLQSDLILLPTYRFRVRVRRDDTGKDSQFSDYLTATEALNPFSDDQSLLYWLSLNVYNRCTCLNPLRNPVSTQVYYNEKHQTYYSDCYVNRFVAFFNRQAKPVPKPSQVFLDEFKEFVNKYMKDFDVFVRHLQYDSWSPQQYIDQTEDVEKRQKYQDGYNYLKKRVELKEQTMYKQLMSTMKDSKCNMMAKTKENFMHENHYVFNDNRPRLISSPGKEQAAIANAYNKTALEVLKKYEEQSIPLGMNTDEMEEFFFQHFGFEQGHSLMDGDGSAFDSHQSKELMDIVDNSFHKMFANHYILKQGHKIAEELGLDQVYDGYNIVDDMLSAVINRREIELRSQAMNEGEPKYKPRQYTFKAELHGTVTSGIAVQTTLGNCLRNLLLWRFVCHKLGLQIKIAVLGDDIVFKGKTSELEQLRAKYGQFFVTGEKTIDPEIHGCGVTFKSLSKPSNISEFCSKMLVMRERCYILGRDLRKAVLGTKFNTNGCPDELNYALFKIQTLEWSKSYEFLVFKDDDFSQKHEIESRLKGLLLGRQPAASKDERSLISKLKYKFQQNSRDNQAQNTINDNEIQEYLEQRTGKGKQVMKEIETQIYINIKRKHTFDKTPERSYVRAPAPTPRPVPSLSNRALRWLEIKIKKRIRKTCKWIVKILKYFYKLMMLAAVCWMLHCMSNRPQSFPFSCALLMFMLMLKYFFFE